MCCMLPAVSILAFLMCLKYHEIRCGLEKLRMHTLPSKSSRNTNAGAHTKQKFITLKLSNILMSTN